MIIIYIFYFFFIPAYSDMLNSEDLITDVVSQVADISFVGAEVQEVKHGARRRFYDDLRRAASCSNHTQLHMLRKRRKPCTMTSFDDKQIVIALHSRKLRPLPSKEILTTVRAFYSLLKVLLYTLLNLYN